VSRQLSSLAQSLCVAQLWPQKSLPAYCTQVAALGQSAVVLQLVQVVPPLLPPPAPEVHAPATQDLPAPHATHAAAWAPHASTVLPSSQPFDPQHPLQLAREQWTLWSQASSSDASAKAMRRIGP
jgi:hypothetical protein